MRAFHPLLIVFRSFTFLLVTTLIMLASSQPAFSQWKEGGNDGKVVRISKDDPALCEVRFESPFEFVRGQTLSVFRARKDNNKEEYVAILIVTRTRGLTLIGRCMGVAPQGGDIVRNAPLLDAFGRERGQFPEFVRRAEELAAIIQELKDDRIGIQFAIRKRLEADLRLAEHFAAKERAAAQFRLDKANELRVAAEKARDQAITKKKEAIVDRDNAITQMKIAQKNEKAAQATLVVIQNKTKKAVTDKNEADEKRRDALMLLARVATVRKAWQDKQPGEKVEHIVRAVSEDNPAFLGIEVKDIPGRLKEDPAFLKELISFLQGLLKEE